MTAAPLDFTFVPMSEISQRQPWMIGRDEQLEELRDELSHRREFYRMLVDKKEMRPEDAERHILVWDAIVSDMVAASAGQRRDAEHLRRAERLQERILWEEKVRELRREIAIRRRSFPRRVESGRMPAGVARTRLETIEGTHWRYWIRGFVWSDILFDIDADTRGKRFRDFEVPRLEWLLEQMDAGAPWAWPERIPDRAWVEEYCRAWRADRACGLRVMEEAA